VNRDRLRGGHRRADAARILQRDRPSVEVAGERRECASAIDARGAVLRGQGYGRWRRLEKRQPKRLVEEVHDQEQREQ
jgi:hypothetical protein